MLSTYSHSRQTYQYNFPKYLSMPTYCEFGCLIILVNYLSVQSKYLLAECTKYAVKHVFTISNVVYGCFILSKMINGDRSNGKTTDSECVRFANLCKQIFGTLDNWRDKCCKLSAKTFICISLCDHISRSKLVQ